MKNRNPFVDIAVTAFLLSATAFTLTATAWLGASF